MKWDDHRWWANKFGISDDVAEYVNMIVDLSEENRLPEEYKQDIEAAADAIAENQGAKRGNSALSAVIAVDALGHDAGRRKPSRGTVAAECTLRHLRQKGRSFVDAWYLHHHLDYLHEQRSTGDDLREVLMRYKGEYPKAYSRQIEKFLLKQEKTLASELGYPNT